MKRGYLQRRLLLTPGYFQKRLLLAPLTWLGISLVVFVLLHLTPGGPMETQLAAWRADATASASLDRNTVQTALAHTYGFDEPILTRYRHWLGAWLRGDWGMSFRYGRPVRALVAERAGRTLSLALAALLLAYALGLPLGAWLAARHGRRRAAGASAGLLALHALPAFVIALAWLRAGGRGASALGPVLAYAAGAVAGIAFLTRHAFVDESRRGYVTALRARGLSTARLYRNLLPRALSPLLGNFAQVLGYFAAGTVLVEMVFDVRGLGRLSYEASLARDYPVLIAVVMLLATVQIVAQLAADALLTFIDPRLRFEGIEG